MPDLVPIKRALLSVSDKTGLAEFATALVNEFKVELISTGGTAKFLRDLNLPVKDVSDVTGFPEMMDGRVKTLHPKIHGALLALRDHTDHLASMQAHDIQPIDLVCINLYPFAKTIEKPDVSLEEAIENIDIGGPSMIRSAAKNHGWVLVVTSPSRYEKVLGDLRQHGGRSCAKHRLKQSQSAFAHTAEYDGLIAKYLAKHITPEVARELTEREEQPASGPARHMISPHSGAVATATAVAEPLEPSTSSSMVPVDRPPDLEDATAAAMTVRQSADTAPNRTKFFADLLFGQARASAGTESCVFSIEQSGELRLAFYATSSRAMFVRESDDADLFIPIARGAVQMNRDEVVELSKASLYPTGAPAYALVTPLRYSGRTDAVAIQVVRCATKQEANDRLMAVQLVAGEYGRFADRQLQTMLIDRSNTLPAQMTLSLSSKQSLRYGENPHQSAALYVDKQPAEASVAYATQLHGKELSYINLLDADGALSAVKEFSTPAACIVKHTTPCGCATAATIAEAFTRAFAGDPLAAFGGIVAMNRPVDLAAAQAITSIDKLLEVIVAPSFDDDALALLKDRWKNVRLLAVGTVDQFDAGEFHLHRIVGGYLVQQRDLTGDDDSNWRVASVLQPTPEEMLDLKFAWKVCKHVKSNAIVIAKNQMLLGAGAGQMDRPSAARLAIAKAGDHGQGGVAASDAFFPFPDGPELLLNAGVTAIIHPGGSLKDQLTIDLANARGAVVVLTGERHFKH